MRQAVAALVALLFLIVGAPALAQSFPAFTGLVVDAANVIPAPEKVALGAELQDLQARTGRQLVVATIPDLQGYAIEDYGYRLGRAWGVGLKDVNNGAILIVAPKDRKVRVEVGYGLEPVLTDAFSSVVINSAILPAFKAGDLPGGIKAGTDALVQQLELPDAEALAKAKTAAAEYDRAHARRQGGGTPISLIFWGIVLLFMIGPRLFGGGGRRFGGGLWPIFLWGPGFGGGWGGGRSSGDGGSSGGGWMGGGGGGGSSGGGGGSFGGGGASGGW